MDKLDEDTRHFLIYLDSLFKGRYFNITCRLYNSRITIFTINFDVNAKHYKMLCYKYAGVNHCAGY